MQESNSYKSRRTELYGRYKAELAAGVRDDRLDPKKAISYGFTYFGGILKEQAGDISLALAGYNAGPHRVKQFIGLPPYSETVSFRNNVLRFYREYLAASK
jgi:soluble lytic murein transglycosylase-like protein